MTREYKILSATTAAKLEDAVKHHIAQGYTVIGGVTAAGRKLYQAIRK